MLSVFLVGRDGHVGDRAELCRVDEAIGHLSQGRESREHNVLGWLSVGASGHIIRNGERCTGGDSLSVHCVASRLVFLLMSTFNHGCLTFSSRNAQSFTHLG